MNSRSTRRQFLEGVLNAGASVTMGSFLGSSTAACAAPVDPHPGGTFDLVAAGMPYRQDDPAWADDVMWDRDLVIRADTKLNGHSRADAEELLRKFDDGNTISNEGCLLTCLAMVLRLLAPESRPTWTPKNLNARAQELYYYTRSGLSMTALYADLVSEVSDGGVQLCAKEEYLPGEPSWPRVYSNTSVLVRAYRSLRSGERKNFLLMLKIGTYDDTVASHYVLLNPDSPDSPDEQDPEILDPAKPLSRTGVWRLSDSSHRITADPEIAAAWAGSGIKPTQIGGAWVFTRWDGTHKRALVEPLVRAWAAELAAGSR